MANNNRTNEYKTGVVFVILCQIIWGVLPIYWQALVPIESWKIILYRIVTMFIYSYIAARLRYTRSEIWGPFKHAKVVLHYLIAGTLLTANWSIYIWAMTSGRMIQSSIGYYIEPIVICVFGVIFFKEKFTKYNGTAFILACIAIVIILVHYRQVPVVALGLALTWASYSAIKKSSSRPAAIELVYETVIFAIFALVAIVYIETKGIGALSLNVPGKYALMLLSGLFTLIPITLFGVATKKVSLFIVGLAQYISPTMTLLFGIFIYHEEIDIVQIMAFIIIWIGLVFFTLGEFRNNQKSIE